MTVITFGKVAISIFIYAMFFCDFFLITIFHFYFLDGEIESGGMNWLDVKRLVLSTGSIRASSGEWSGSQRPQGVYVRQTQQSKLGQEHHKPSVRSREQKTARPEAPKGLLKFAAPPEVIDLIETQVGAVFKEAVQTIH